MELPPHYFEDLGRAALRFTACAALLVAAAFALRRRLDRQRLAATFRWVFLTLVYTVVAAVVLNAFMTRWGFRGDAPNHGFVHLLDHTAHRPFVYRVLSPAVVNAAASLVPEAAKSAWKPWLLRETPLLRYRAPYESWNPDKALKWHVAYGYLFLCLMAALFAARSLARAVTPVSALFSDYAPAVALLLLPLTFLRGGYLYDFSELMFLFLCTLCASRGRWLLYYVLFILAVLNKESNVLVAAIFVAFAASRLPPRQWLGHVACQLAIGAALIAALHVVFRDAGGGSTQAWFPLNVLFLLSPEWYAKFFSPYAPLVPLPRGINLISLALLAFIALWRWQQKPLEVRRLFLLTGAATLPLYVLFGFLDEIRALSLVFPAIYLLGCHTLDDLYRRGGAIESSGSGTREGG